MDEQQKKNFNTKSKWIGERRRRRKKNHIETQLNDPWLIKANISLTLFFCFVLLYLFLYMKQKNTTIHVEWDFFFFSQIKRIPMYLQLLLLLHTISICNNIWHILFFRLLSSSFFCFFVFYRRFFFKSSTWPKCPTAFWLLLVLFIVIKVSLIRI